MINLNYDFSSGFIIGIVSWNILRILIKVIFDKKNKPKLAVKKK